MYVEPSGKLTVKLICNLHFMHKCLEDGHCPVCKLDRNILFTDGEILRPNGMHLSLTAINQRRDYKLIRRDGHVTETRTPSGEKAL